MGYTTVRDLINFKKSTDTTTPIPLAGLVIHCPWCGDRMIGFEKDFVCREHGWFVVIAELDVEKKPLISMHSKRRC